MDVMPFNLMKPLLEEFDSNKSTYDSPDSVYFLTLCDRKAELKFKNGMHYVGEIKNGFFDGKGKLELPSGLIFTGHFEQNQMVGKGRIDYPDGSVYNGTVVNFTKEGKGTLEQQSKQLNYSGGWSKDKFDGVGTLEIEGKFKYEGEFRNGIKHGQGKITFFQSGTVYEGEFYRNIRKGKGTAIFPLQNQKYIGDWENNQISGTGVYIYKTDRFTNSKHFDEFFQGRFDAGVRQGFGVQLYANGSVLIGNWRLGKKEGSALFLDFLGKVYWKKFKGDHLELSECLDKEDELGEAQLNLLKFPREIPQFDSDEKLFSKVLRSFKQFLRETYLEILNSSVETKFFRGLVSCKIVTYKDVVEWMEKIRFFNLDFTKDVLKAIGATVSRTLFDPEFFAENLDELLKIHKAVETNKDNGVFFSDKLPTSQTPVLFYNFLQLLFCAIQTRREELCTSESILRSFFNTNIVAITKGSRRPIAFIPNEQKIKENYNQYLTAYEKPLKVLYTSLCHPVLKIVEVRSLVNHLIRCKFLTEKLQSSEFKVLVKIIERFNDPGTTLYSLIRKRDCKLDDSVLLDRFNKWLSLTLSYNEFTTTVTLFFHLAFEDPDNTHLVMEAKVRLKEFFSNPLKANRYKTRKLNEKTFVPVKNNENKEEAPLSPTSAKDCPSSLESMAAEPELAANSEEEMVCVEVREESEEVEQNNSDDDGLSRFYEEFV